MNKRIGTDGRIHRGNAPGEPMAESEEVLKRMLGTNAGDKMYKSHFAAEVQPASVESEKFVTDAKSVVLKLIDSGTMTFGLP